MDKKGQGSVFSDENDQRLLVVGKEMFFNALFDHVKSQTCYFCDVGASSDSTDECLVVKQNPRINRHAPPHSSHFSG